jgi:hypothetical protein
MKKSNLPEEVFHGFAAVFPRLVQLAQSCQLSPIDVFVLWHIRHFGIKEKGDSGPKMVLRQDLTKVLKNEFKHSDANVSKLIKDLENQEFISCKDLSEHSRNELFGKEAGRRKVVIITDRGSEQIELFKEKIQTLIDDAMKRMPVAMRMTTKAFLPVGASLAKWFIESHSNKDISAGKKAPAKNSQ